MTDSDLCQACSLTNLIKQKDIWIHSFNNKKRDPGEIHQLTISDKIDQEIDKIPSIDFFTEEYYHQERRCFLTGKTIKSSELKPYHWLGYKPPIGAWFSCGTWISNKYLEASLDDHEEHCPFHNTDLIAIHLNPTLKDRLYIIDSFQKVVEFTEKYMTKDVFNTERINWWQVKEDGFAGIIFTQPKIRFFHDYPQDIDWNDTMKFMWSQGYDTESLVVWDVSLLKDTKAIKLVFND
tara:strand:+ start:6405 stop:7112 length:708 start_codon:yes stop_codon:yes gene_type:complete